jgi:hypothetical protein
MNPTINNFLKPGTDLKKMVAGIAITLFFIAGTAGLMGWISGSVSGSILAQSM